MPPPRKANIAHDADHPTTWNEHAEAMPPHLVKLIMKPLVIFDKAELVGVRGVLFERPVRRRCDNQMDRLFRNPINLASIPAVNSVR